MERIYFIIISILFLVFVKLNIVYKKKHNNESILEESKVKKTFEVATTIDEIFRIITDISPFLV